jgi:hypothetical protein
MGDAFKIDEADPIGSVFAPLIGLPAWNVKKGHGSFLTFEFGTPHLYIREPREPIAELSTQDSPMRRQLQRRLVVPHGDWHLWIYCCHWRCSENGIERSMSESSDAEIIAAAKSMDGQRLISIVVDPTAGRSLFHFDLGATLETWPYGDDANDEQWFLFTPSKYVLGYRADGHYSWVKDNQPSNEERWFPAPRA